MGTLLLVFVLLILAFPFCVGVLQVARGNTRRGISLIAVPLVILIVVFEYFTIVSKRTMINSETQPPIVVTPGKP